MIFIIHVFLDDLRPCPTGFALARSAAECVLLLQECKIGVLSLDFELGWDQPNGLHVVRYIVASGRYPQEIYFHTSSSSGKRSMYEMLYQSKPEFVKLTYGPAPDQVLQHIANNVQE